MQVANRALPPSSWLKVNGKGKEEEETKLKASQHEDANQFASSGTVTGAVFT